MPSASIHSLHCRETKVPEAEVEAAAEDLVVEEDSAEGLEGLVGEAASYQEGEDVAEGSQDSGGLREEDLSEGEGAPGETSREAEEERAALDFKSTKHHFFTIKNWQVLFNTCCCKCFPTASFF